MIIGKMCFPNCTIIVTAIQAVEKSGASRKLEFRLERKLFSLIFQANVIHEM